MWSGTYAFYIGSGRNLTEQRTDQVQNEGLVDKMKVLRNTISFIWIRGNKKSQGYWNLFLSHSGPPVCIGNHKKRAILKENRNECFVWLLCMNKNPQLLHTACLTIPSLATDCGVGVGPPGSQHRGTPLSRVIFRGDSPRCPIPPGWGLTDRPNIEHYTIPMAGREDSCRPKSTLSHTYHAITFQGYD